MSEADMLKGRNPFLWKGDSREAVLCIHGFVGAPGVFRKLGRKLQSDALTVYAPMLPGHGTVPEDLADVTGEQLLGAVEQAYTKLARSYERVHLAGLSLGGNVGYASCSKPCWGEQLRMHFSDFSLLRIQ